MMNLTKIHGFCPVFNSNM